MCKRSTTSSYAAAADGDLEKVVYYAVSDISQIWGYHQLRQGESWNGPSGQVRKSALDIVLCYREGQAPSAKMAFNQQLAWDISSADTTRMFSGSAGGSVVRN